MRPSNFGAAATPRRRFHAPLNHVVQKAPVVDLPLGRPVLPGFLQGPHHVTCRRRDESVEVAAPRDAPIQAGLQIDREGRMHG